ncbi:hypothetical protein SPRG_16399 [Saprolegnia parasitica CBS 223.65]|uniref:Uncharacterized protein n=1 Tax=Saprolegnia parasitica (strain CBS 223.65) TaxID=695850 RepID=A0A067BI44_SAPPC|nr:hypothetical protein SPRG_16399 [Saprolegnia parasitica CBS 223.65]KDO17823.1 hypothetical protein SPRG_16399 [Saprolegnia parasitica CBS 223.65]|eukprot:XP_012211469.1 hypothetical protein SPRG_16399 [Saprolegnia parasitica CBS 223.65]
MTLWNKDICAEPSCRCGKSSAELLIDYLNYQTTDGYVNYKRWKGGSKKRDGKSKITIAGEIAAMIKEHGLTRTSKSVKTKIEELHTKFNEAIDKFGYTGEGMMHGMQESTKAVEKAAARLFESRQAELEYKKTKHKSEAEAKMAELEYRKAKDKADADAKTDDRKLKQEEINIKKEEVAIKRSAQRHAATMEEARLMREMGYSKEEVLDYIRQNK